MVSFVIICHMYSNVIIVKFIMCVCCNASVNV